MSKPKAKSLQQKLGFFDDDLKSPDHDTILLWLDKNIDAVLLEVYNFTDWSEATKNELSTKVDELVSLELKCEKRLYDILSGKRTTYELPDNSGSFYRNTAGSRERWRERVLEACKLANNKSEATDKLKSTKKKIALLNGFKGLGSNLPVRQAPKTIDRKWEFPVTNSSQNPKTGYKSAKGIIGFLDMMITFSFTRLDVAGVDFYNASIYEEPKWMQTEFEEYSSSQKNTHKLYIEVKTKIPSLGELFRQLNTYREYEQGDYLVVCPDDTHRETIINQGFKFFKYGE